MARNYQIDDSRKGCCKKTNYFMYLVTLNTIDELLLKLNHNCVLKIHTFFHDIGDLMRSIECKTQSKQAEFITNTIKNIEILRELREKRSTHDSSSQMGDKVINVDTRALKIQKEAVNAITSAAHLVAVLNQIHRENLPRVVKDFAHLRLLLRIYAENSALDNVVPKCGCALRSIGTGTQSNTVNGEFSSETSFDVPMKACGKKRHADFIPEQIAKVSDTLTAKARLACDVMTEEMVLYTRKSVMSMADRMKEETLEGKESLISSIIDAEEKSNNATVTDVATNAVQQEFLPIRQDSTTFSDETFQMSRIDESLNAKVPALLFIEEMRTDGDIMSVKHIEKNDPPDTSAITAVVTSEKEEEEQKKEKESLNEVSLRLAIDKDISVVNKTALNAIVGSTVTDSVENAIREPIYIYPARYTLEESISTKYKKPLSEKTRTIEEIEVKHSPAEESAPLAHDMFLESVQIKHKMPRHRMTWAAKKTDEVETSPVGKPTQPAKNMFQEIVQPTYGMSRFKKIRTIKKTVVETSPAGEEHTQLTKDTLQDSAQTKYKVSRFKKTRTIKNTENETSPAGESTPSVNDVLRKTVQSVQTTHKTVRSKKNPTTKSIESCSINTLASFTCPKPTKRSCDYFERSTAGISQDCRQLKFLQPKCCGRFRHCDASRLSLRNEVMRNTTLGGHVCYPFLQDPCVNRCRGGYWWWRKACDTNSHSKYGASIGNALHTHAYCNGNTGYYCPHLNAIDNCWTAHCHWNDGRSVWNDDQHYGRN